MKVIETKYKGYRFRSRLEARWAVYFDTIGIEWEYEKEGFEFNNGEKYLPDFWLPQVNMWAEVKPGRFSDDELKKVKALVMETSFPCILLEGTPDLRSYGVVQWGPMLEGDTIREKLIIGDRGGNDCVVSMAKDYPIQEHRFYSCTGGILSEEDFDNMFSDVRPAVEKARSARFEFGER